MTIDEQIKILESNAEFERKDGDLQGCLNFRQLAEWLKELKRHREAWEKMETALNAMTNRCYVTRFNYAIEEVIDVVKEYRPKEGDAE